MIYGYRVEIRQSHPNFSQVIRGYEIVRNGLRFRGDLYFKYSGGTSGNYYGVYEGDLYFIERAWYIKCARLMQTDLYGNRHF